MEEVTKGKMNQVLKDVWHGLWTGFGVEVSVLLLWLGWSFFHGVIGHKMHKEHWVHKIGEYFE